MDWQHKEWLTLGEVAHILGVHPSTVRLWADQGKIPVHRTQGGHRRFRRSELELWMLARKREEGETLPRDAIMSALRSVRIQIAEGALDKEEWYKKLDDVAREHYRRTGRVMVQSLWAYLAEGTPEGEVEAKSLGYEYAARGRQYGLSVYETARSFIFFHGLLIDSLREAFENSEIPSAKIWGELVKRLNRFSKLVLLTLLETYESYEQKYNLEDNDSA